MIRYASEVTISRPPSEVFPYLIEREKQALWSEVPMTPLTEGPLRAGSRMRLTFGKRPLRTSLTLEFAALEPNQRVAFTTASEGGLQWTGEYRLAPPAEGTGTHLSQKGTLEFRGLWRLAEPLIGAEIRRGEIAELEKLKAVLESAPEA
jgi:uncharacterized protein YndB with AHSA1/START domain